MKVAIISDIHDNIPNLNKALNYIREQQIEKIICCGDFGSENTLIYLAENFSGKIWSVLGNADRGKIECDVINSKYGNFTIAEIACEFDIQGNRCLIVHEPDHYEGYLNKDEIEYIFHGHTHKPWQESKEGKLILNPGNVGNFKYPPTFAIWDVDGDRFKLIQLNII